MRQRVLLFSAVLFFGLSLVIITGLSLNASSTSGPCLCFEYVDPPECPPGKTFVSFHQHSNCDGKDCRTTISSKCRCNCCGAITYANHHQTVSNCEDCDIPDEIEW